MAQVPAETTSLQVPSSEDGLPDASDRVVRDLDVYLVNGELSGAQVCSRGSAWAPPPPPAAAAAAAASCLPLKLPSRRHLQTYLLQFPLRPPWRPYHTDTEGFENVKLKPKARRSCRVARAGCSVLFA